MFKLKEKKANFFTEIIAGLTTFFAMSYVILVTPQMLAQGNKAMETSVFIATCLAAFFGTLLMGLLANLPFAMAPGMSVTAFFAYTAMAAKGYSYAEALSIVFISGLIFVLLTAIGLREAVTKAIPKNLKYALAVGIGILLAYIGLQRIGFISSGSEFAGISGIKGILTGDKAVFSMLIALAGVVIISALHRFRIPASILIGMVLTGALYWLIAIPAGYDVLPKASVSFGDLGGQFGTWFKTSVGLCLRDGMIGLFKGQNVVKTLLSVGAVVLSFTFIDIFDSVGSIFGTAAKSGMLDDEGNMPNMKRAMFASAIATSVGAILGTPAVTAYPESSAGVTTGGKTGLSSLITSLCFLAALVLAPFTGYIPTAATSAAIIFVGILLIGAAKNIDWSNISEALPAFFCIIAMPLTGSIAEGIFIGIIAHVIINVVCLRFRKISIIEVILAALFVLKYLFV